MSLPGIVYILMWGYNTLSDSVSYMGMKLAGTSLNIFCKQTESYWREGQGRECSLLYM